MATTVMNGNDCFKNGNDCFKWQRPFTKGKISSLTDPDIFIAVFGFLQLILLAEKCFQLQVYFCCNIYEK